MTLYLLVPLVAAVAFAVGSLVYKRAFAEGAGIAHAVILNNVALAVAFLPLFWVDSRPVPWGLVHLPAITATTFVLGHLLNVLSLRLGDVSVATPLLGAKVVMVALLGRVVFDWPVAPAQFVAAALATGGVLVMGAADWHGGRRTGLTILLALGCALCFAFTDVLIQLWAAPFGTFNFLPLLFLALAAESLVFLPFLGRASLRAPKAAWKWIGLATICSALQAILVTWSIGHWRDAAGVNVVYGTRGLWSLALVWWAGRWFGNTERASVGRRTFALRVAGGVVILAAVVVAIRGAPAR